MKAAIFTFLSLSAILNITWSQIQIYPGPDVNPADMVEYFTGDGIVYSNITFQGDPISRGIFSNGQTTNLGMESGIFLTSGAGYIIPGPNNSSSAGVNNGNPGHAFLNLITTSTTYDAAVLEFDFIPFSDTIKFSYVFGSEEYNEWVGSSYNDVFGALVTGPDPLGGNYYNKNIAVIPGSTASITINSVNNGFSLWGIIPTGPCMNCEYYDDNTNGLTLQYDGLTTVLTGFLHVIPCEEYHILVGIADAGDGIEDAGVFLSSFVSAGPEIEVTTILDPPGLTENLVEGHVEADLVFKLPNPEYAPVTICFEIGGTAVNGIEYEEIDPCITFEEGEDSTSIHITPYQDGMLEGEETIVLIIENPLGCEVKYDTVEVIIEDYLEMITQSSPNTSVCSGQEVELWANAILGFPLYSYVWEPGGFTGDTITVTPEETTMFVVTITDLFQDSVQDSVLVTVFPVCDLETFYFEAFLNPGLPYDVYGEVTDDTVFVDFPPGTNLGALIPSYTFNNEACTDSVGAINDFTYPVVYEFLGPGGCSSQWVVIAEIETGINKNPAGNFMITPNPSDGKFTIEFKEVISAPVSMEVHDLIGNIVYKTQASTTKAEIDLSDIPKGMYFVRMKSGDEVFSRKLILQ